MTKLIKDILSVLLLSGMMTGCGTVDSIDDLSGGDASRGADKVTMDYQEGDHGYFDVNVSILSDEAVMLSLVPVSGDGVLFLRAEHKGEFYLSCMPVADVINENGVFDSVKITCGGIGPDAVGDIVNIEFSFVVKKYNIYDVKFEYENAPRVGSTFYKFTAEDNLQVTIQEQ